MLSGAERTFKKLQFGIFDALWRIFAKRDPEQGTVNQN